MRSNHRRYIVSSAIALGVAASQSAFAAEELLMGYLRQDGIVIPFARFDGLDWKALQHEDFHVTEEDGRAWYLVNANGDPSTLRAGIWVDLVWDPSGEAGPPFRGQVTDYCAQNLGGDASFEPRIVLSEPRGARAFEVVRQGSVTWDSAIARVEAEFERQESLGVAIDPSRRTGAPTLAWGHPISENTRRKFATKVAMAEARPPDAPALLQATGTRQYPSPPSDEACPGRSDWTGWARESRGRWDLIDGRLQIENCDAKSTAFQTPLLYLSMEERVFVVVDETGYEWGAYIILEVTESGLKRVFAHMYHCL
jgi:hypothetical protein